MKAILRSGFLALAIMLALAVRANAGPFEDEVIKGNCLLNIDDIDYISGSCDIRLMDDGSFGVLQGKPNYKYFSYVLLEKPGEAIGWWNEEPYANHAQPTH